ncbi:MAG: hypothetical protein U1D31_03580 [Patescibacteria group bacterium]|nr:hypothetical protein [bacterium]MDZ4241173.1 hypothetical protein [Patescibacteria group bacterium]
MHSKKLIQYTISLGALAAVFYPIFVWFGNSDLSWNKTVVFEIFPVLGLIAFSIMWLHIVGGPFREKLEQYFDYKKFMTISSIVVLICIVLHPLLIYVGFWLIGVKGSGFTYAPGDKQYLVWFAIVAWLIFVAYDILKKFKNTDFFVRHWYIVKLIATLGFFLILFHSLGLGGDLRTGSLRYVWIFYGITAAIAAIYTYGIQPFFKLKSV